MKRPIDPWEGQIRDLTRRIIDNPPEELTAEQWLRLAVDSPDTFDAFIRLLRETPALLEVYFALTRLTKRKGRPRKRKVVGYSGDDCTCIFLMEALSRETGETKTQTLAREAYKQSIENGWIEKVKTREYWTTIERLARLWKQRVERQPVESKRSIPEK